MLVISSAELRNNTEKYLDLVATRPVVIRRGATETFILQAEKHLAPDDDLARAITIDELLTGVKSDIRAMYTKDKK